MKISNPAPAPADFASPPAIGSSTPAAITGTTLTATTGVTLPVGSLTVPALNFTAETNSGFYRAGAGNFGVVVLGTARALFTASGITTMGRNYINEWGDAALPGRTWDGDPDTGIANGGGNIQIFAAGGAEIFRHNTTGIVIASGKTLQLGNAATTGLTAGVLAALTNSSIVLTDSNGQAYRIPCII